MNRQRNFTAEYADRVARGAARGLSRSQSRGHARTSKGELPASVVKIKDKGSLHEKFDYVSRQVLSGKKSATAARKEVGLSARQLNERRLEQSPSLFKSGKRYKAKQFEISYFTPGSESVQYSTFTGASAHWMRKYKDMLAIIRKGDRRSAAYKEASSTFQTMSDDLKIGRVKIYDVVGKRVYPITNPAHIDYLMQQLTEAEYQDYQEAHYRLAEAA
jgi:hypothetical protein